MAGTQLVLLLFKLNIYYCRIGTSQYQLFLPGFHPLSLFPTLQVDAQSQKPSVVNEVDSHTSITSNYFLHYLT